MTPVFSRVNAMILVGDVGGTCARLALVSEDSDGAAANPALAGAIRYALDDQHEAET